MSESNDEESNNNNLYLFLLFVALILIVAAYARIPAFREMADAKAPWFRDNVGHYLVDGKSGGDKKDGDSSDANGAGEPRPFDINIFAAHPETWPRTVTIKTPTQFPAVVNEKPVGFIQAPAGSEVNLVRVENGKLGVEFKGGGKWIAPEATDLIERVQASAASRR